LLAGETAPAQILPTARISRRVEQRLGVDTRVVLRLIDLAADIPGRIIDISLGGCHIRTERRFPVGIFRRVEIEFRMEGLPFRLGGVTQAVYDPFNVGLRFLDLSERKREQLMQLIDEIKAVQPESD
jgi:c-di-GMP-binding flagellar brake protein YcgR